MWCAVGQGYVTEVSICKSRTDTGCVVIMQWLDSMSILSMRNHSWLWRCLLLAFLHEASTESDIILQQCVCVAIVVITQLSSWKLSVWQWASCYHVSVTCRLTPSADEEQEMWLKVWKRLESGPSDVVKPNRYEKDWASILKKMMTHMCNCDIIGFHYFSWYHILIHIVLQQCSLVWCHLGHIFGGMTPLTCLCYLIFPTWINYTLKGNTNVMHNFCPSGGLNMPLQNNIM